LTAEREVSEGHEGPSEPISSEAETKPPHGGVDAPTIERIRHALQHHEALEKKKRVGTPYVLLALVIAGGVC